MKVVAEMVAFSVLCVSFSKSDEDRGLEEVREEVNQERTCMTGNIRSSERDSQSTCSDLNSHKEDTSKQQTSVILRSGPADDRSSNRDQSQNDDQDMADIVDFACYVAAGDDGDGRDASNWASKSQRCEMRKTKAVNNDSSKGSKCS